MHVLLKDKGGQEGTVAQRKADF